MDWQTALHRHLASAARPLVVVLGPTASGKTAFSIDLAEDVAATSSEHGWLGAEVINADSRQLYRGMDIGTAKVTPEEARGVPHHLLDVLDPSEEVTMSWYKEQAEAAIAEILSRKHVPMLVGGSMLYISAVIDGLQPLPAVPAEIRQKIKEEYEKDDGKTLHARIAAADPESAQTFHPNNRHAIIRAAELLEMTGSAPSTLKTQSEVPYDLLMFGMRWPREKIVERINARTDVLLTGGWIPEVRGLLARGFGVDTPGLMSHGYREVAATILAHPDWTDAEVTADPELREIVAKNTRDYAKRQMTWWRGDERIVWMDRD
jgi:tRNA dimethylallyltransferase